MNVSYGFIYLCEMQNLESRTELVLPSVLQVGKLKLSESFSTLLSPNLKYFSEVQTDGASELQGKARQTGEKEEGNLK